jgi:cyclic pyranopterin phosphate synthase
MTSGTTKAKAKQLRQQANKLRSTSETERAGEAGGVEREHARTRQGTQPRERLLKDSFGRVHTYLRISVTDRCNLRCVYCMPYEGIIFKDNKQLLTFEEIVRLARIFVDMGVTKIRLTGGEPLVRRNLEVLAKQLKEIAGLETLAMTTNATLLAGKARSLKDAGLDALNISLDTFQKERFVQISRRDDFDQVMAGIEAAFEFGFSSIKLNMVVIGGLNDDEVMDFADFAAQRQVNVRFIEYMPFKNNGWAADRVVTFADIKQRIASKYELRPIETEPSAVAKDFSIVGGKGSLSFISSMSDSFCATCNRVRLTSDGALKSCLFYPAELSLRDAMRAGADDERLLQLIREALWQKPEAHPPAEEIAAEENRTMIEIGG